MFAGDGLGDDGRQAHAPFGGGWPGKKSQDCDRGRFHQKVTRLRNRQCCTGGRMRCIRGLRCRAQKSAFDGDAGQPYQHPDANVVVVVHGCPGGGSVHYPVGPEKKRREGSGWFRGTTSNQRASMAEWLQWTGGGNGRISRRLFASTHHNLHMHHPPSTSQFYKYILHQDRGASWFALGQAKRAVCVMQTAISHREFQISPGAVDKEILCSSVAQKNKNKKRETAILVIDPPPSLGKKRRLRILCLPCRDMGGRSAFRCPFLTLLKLLCRSSVLYCCTTVPSPCPLVLRSQLVSREAQPFS